MILRKLIAAGWMAAFITVQVLACTVEETNSSDDDDSGAGGAGTTDVTVLCEEQCILEHPTGQEAYELVRSCLFCGACFDLCTGENPALCPNGGGDLGCSINATTCGECTQQPCALAQSADTSFTGACAPYGQQCASNAECVGLNNCVVDCVAAGGPVTMTTGSSSTGTGTSSAGSAVSSTGTGG